MDLKSEIEHIDTQTRHTVASLRAAGVTPCLVDIVASDDEAVASYARTKQRKAEKLGVGYRVETLDASRTTADAAALVQQLNADSAVHGVMVSTPVYAHLDTDQIIEHIAALKDVDGLTSANLGLLTANAAHRALVPATALATLHILERLCELRGKDVVVVGRGKTVGRPVAALLSHRDATVTVCHSKTAQLSLHTRRAQVLVVAIGRPGFITAEMVSPGQLVIDCGTNVVDGKTCGDVDPEVAPVVGYLSPVPGGVGGLTNTFIFSNLLKAAALQQGGALAGYRAN
jgi:methylenetetrahydrofolate dehydrogenase (NADP+)/methenyltetrahydrofolate cyclohydrolase